MGGKPLNQPIVGMSVTQDGNGYTLVASDGGVFNYGDSQFYGSLPGVLKPGQTLNSPIEGIVNTPDGGGYWMVAADGGIFTFGDAPFLGSLGSEHLASPIAGMFANGNGYTLVAQDGTCTRSPDGTRTDERHLAGRWLVAGLRWEVVSATLLVVNRG